MTKRFDILKRKKLVAFVQDATLYRVCEDGYSTPVCECEETAQAAKTTYLKRLCDSNVSVSLLGIEIVNRWMPDS